MRRFLLPLVSALASVVVLGQVAAFAETLVIPAANKAGEDAAIIVVATRAQPITLDTHFLFKRVNIETQEFIDERFALGLREKKKNINRQAKTNFNGGAANFRFSLLRVPPGAYASAVVASDWDDGLLRGRSTVCLSQGAPIINLKPGVVTLFLSGPHPSYHDQLTLNSAREADRRVQNRAMIEQEFAQVRSGIPELPETFEFADSSIRISWEAENPGACLRAESFKMLE
ncbi:hypothetical protein K1X12_03070 [Hyphomonas sp. WL0036]|uniref:hypothetical protein n=1 Tax=Hyphomonas sediminis TaxID=2866160 RepID=UPI001C7E8AE2|nr:hypothetical protein [Hyphomonas sediminis]MBY9065860.1 hypothetical protein [Hyphomonas sediminis]